jgi:putative glutamine amidotransferase
VPGAIGFALAASTGDGARVLNVEVFGATISYALMALSHIVLRRREPELPRPYRTPGGILTSSVALALAWSALVATFLVDREAAFIALAVYGVALAYFAFYSRRHLVAAARRRSSRPWPRPRRSCHATDRRELVSKPLIGITTYLDASVRWGVWHQHAALLPSGYHRLVQRAGGLAALLPPDEPAAAGTAVARIDGLVVSGGPDVEPARYGAEPHQETGPPARERDAWELALIRAALAAGKPLLGICRGMQLLNVALGGTLVQHLPEEVGHGGHCGPPGVFAVHEVTAVPGTRLGAILPEAVSVPTYHHQAVDRLGRGLLACAHAEDGTPEAVELADCDGFVLAVQWHPEAGQDPRVVEALVAAAWSL